jgi:hypothetical protein
MIIKKDNVAYDLPSLAISGARGVGDELLISIAAEPYVSSAEMYTHY